MNVPRLRFGLVRIRVWASREYKVRRDDLGSSSYDRHHRPLRVTIPPVGPAVAAGSRLFVPREPRAATAASNRLFASERRRGPAR